ncbi:MAG: VWA domain-containing protein [Pseudomonadota bacterium]
MWARTFLATLLAASVAAADCTEDAIIVFDGSGSMAAAGARLAGETRIAAARRAVAQTIPDIARHRRLGLVIYGPGAGPCTGIDLRFPPMAGAGPAIVAGIDAVSPAGRTPLTDAVTRAADALAPGAGTIVVVTDGKESCGRSPCRLAATLAEQRPEVTIHVIGFEVGGLAFVWNNGDTSIDQEDPGPVSCLAEATGGRFVDTETAEELVAAFRETLGCALRF